MRLAGAAALAAVALALAGCTGAILPPERPATKRVGVDQSAAGAWITAYRRGHGLPPVATDGALQAVAQRQADAMASADELSHTLAGGLPDRLATIHRKGASAENVSAGYPTLEAALAGWQRSPEHNRNLLFAPVHRFGIAATQAPGTRYKTFWALVMTD